MRFIFTRHTMAGVRSRPVELKTVTNDIGMHHRVRSVF